MDDTWDAVNHLENCPRVSFSWIKKDGLSMLLAHRIDFTRGGYFEN